MIHRILKPAVSTHSRLKAAGDHLRHVDLVLLVSTHSRLKAAGRLCCRLQLSKYRFNTQPPKGGCKRAVLFSVIGSVSTHSRLKAAGHAREASLPIKGVSTHSRLKAAGRVFDLFCLLCDRFNTQPPKGGWSQSDLKNRFLCCFNTQPPKGGWSLGTTANYTAAKFQHTAA